MLKLRKSLFSREEKILFTKESLLNYNQWREEEEGEEEEEKEELRRRRSWGDIEQGFQSVAGSEKVCDKYASIRSTLRGWGDG